MMHGSVAVDRPKHLPRLTGGVAVLLMIGFVVSVLSGTRSVSFAQLDTKHQSISSRDIMQVSIEAAIAAGMR